MKTLIKKFLSIADSFATTIAYDFTKKMKASAGFIDGRYDLHAE